MRWSCVVMVSLLACGTPEPRQQPGESARPAAPAPQRRDDTPGKRPSLACTSDGECNIADPCLPARCVAAPPTRAACDRPVPPDGSCVCFEGQCALRPSSPRISQQSCQYTRDCNLDPTTARCAPGITSDADVHVRFDGPTCGCDQRDHRCHLQWFDPIPCRSDDDCWFEDTPVLHAIPRPKRLRGRTFRGCVDGENVPTCAAGHCTLEGLTC